MIRGKALDATIEDGVCWVRFNRPEARNTITPDLISELHQVFDTCEGTVGVVVLEGGSEDFCFGADFAGISSGGAEDPHADRQHVRDLYRLWLRMTDAPFVVVAHVRGRANAGGVGFVAAGDVVVAGDAAAFSLSELLFGLFPAMVLPFLIRRVGFQKAHYLTLMTKPIPATQAANWGLVDACGPRSETLLRQHLSRLKRIPPESIQRYKRYLSRIDPVAPPEREETAVGANLEVFADPANLQRVSRFVELGVYPWES